MSKVDAVLIDSNVIVYSSNTLSSKYKVAAEVRERFRCKDFTGFISHQNIFESLRVLTHPKYENPMSLSEALKQLEALKSFSIVISPTLGTDELALALIDKYQLSSNAVFDAYLVATMLSYGLYKIVTDNVSDLGKFEEIEVINPFN